MERSDADHWIQIGDWRLTPRLNLLEKDGREVRLEPRHADLLCFLAEHHGDVVSAEEILSGVWRGMVVGDHSVYQAIAKLRKALGDDASRARYIETVSKRGYRLIAEVTTPTDLAPQTPKPPITHRSRAWFQQLGIDARNWRPLSLGFAILMLGSVAVVWWDPTEDPAEDPTEDPTEDQATRISPAHPHLAVLPFENLSADAADAFVAQGFAIELAALLGQAQDLVVIGPVSTSLAVQHATQPIEAAPPLAADLIVSGSLRRSADTLRIAATLTDGRSGAQLWSRIFGRADDDVFQVQREVALAIASALEMRLGASATDTPPPSTKDAYDDFLLGQYYRSIRSAASLARAQGFFEQALASDPGFTPARRDLATTHLLLSYYGNLPLREALERAEPLLKQCLDETPEDAELLATIGLSHYLQGAFGLADAYLRRAVSMSPSHVEGWMWLGLSERQQGRLRDALDAFEHARGIEPLMVTTVINNANALAWSGRPEQAKTLLKELTSRVTDHPQLYRALSNIELESGQLGLAHAGAEQALRIDPHDALSRANMAMVLSYLGQDAAVQSFITNTPSTVRSGRATQLYLDRMALTAPQVLPANVQQRYEIRLAEAPNVPEIEWRLANARIGLIDYFSGHLREARERLERSLSGRIDPIERTDYDLFVCTSLVDAQRHLEDEPAASRWLARCAADFEQAGQRGWRSIALGYVAARLSMLQGESERALSQLDRVIEQGFSNRSLLAMDPILEPLRGQATFKALQKRIHSRITAACARISAASNEQGAFVCASSDPAQAQSGD